MSHYDLIILGGGPVGSITASLVRRRNPDRKVLILEKESFPRHHVGETTIPSWRPVLERAGVYDKIREAGTVPKLGGYFHWGAAGDDAWTIDFVEPGTDRPQPGAFQVDRAAFDKLLLDHARSLDCEVIERAEVESVSRGAPPFTVTWKHEGEERSATAAWVVDATGQARLLARLWGLDVHAFDTMNNFAMWGYWQGSKVWTPDGRDPGEARWTYIETCEDGWLWHIPITPELTSVGVVTDASTLPRGGAEAREAFYLRNVREARGIGGLLSEATLVEHALAGAKLLVARDWSYRVEKTCGPGWFLAGDAAAFVDPIFSTGLLIGLNGASMAANALSTIWRDPEVDAPLLLASYQEAYADIALSFHRLASVWYARNEKSQSAYWVARRQRMRAGGDPAAETDREAFMRLCMGAAVNPVEGALQHPMREREVNNVETYVIAENVCGVDGDPAAHGSGETLRLEQRRKTRRRFRELLRVRLALGNAVATRRDGYFTDRAMDSWTRVRYLDVRAAGSTDELDRLVLPFQPFLPDTVVPLLDGTRSGLDVVRLVCDGTAPFSDDRARCYQRVCEQVLQLDLRGWLRVTEAPRDVAAADGLLRLFQSIEPCEVRVDCCGDAIELRSTHGEALLTPRAVRRQFMLETRTTRLSYHGATASEGCLRWMRDLGAALTQFEEAHPNFWQDALPEIAGELDDDGREIPTARPARPIVHAPRAGEFVTLADAE